MQILLNRINLIMHLMFLIFLGSFQSFFHGLALDSITETQTISEGEDGDAADIPVERTRDARWSSRMLDPTEAVKSKPSDVFV